MAVAKRRSATKDAVGKVQGRHRRGSANSKLSAKDIEFFRGLILKRREQLMGDLSQMTDEALGESRQVSNGDVSVMPTHMADLGTDVFDQEFTLELMANEREELKEIDRAIERLENGSFGVCDSCGGRIRKTRLKALPHARCCIGCQREMEQGKG
ncbi:MAG: TraR/DksA family transcriptional regulator [Planctomycetota bacterium]